MKLRDVIEKLKASRQELEALGVRHASVFGSTARGEAGEGSDVDVAVILDQASTPRGFAYISHLDRVEQRLGQILGTPVDVVTEPARKRDIQEEIERERRRAF